MKTNDNLSNAIVGHYIPNSDRRLWEARFVKGWGSPDLLGDSLLHNWITNFNGDSKIMSAALESIKKDEHWVRLVGVNIIEEPMNRKTDRVTPYARPEYRPRPRTTLRHLSCKLGGLKQVIHFAYLFDHQTISLHISKVVNNRLELLKRVSIQVSPLSQFDPLQRELYRYAACKAYDGLYTIMCADYMLDYMDNYKRWENEVPQHLAGIIVNINFAIKLISEHSVVGDKFHDCTDDYIIRCLHKGILEDWGELDPSEYDEDGTAITHPDPMSNDKYFDRLNQLRDIILDFMMKGEMISVLNSYKTVRSKALKKTIGFIQKAARKGNGHYGKSTEHIFKSAHLDLLVECDIAGGVKYV